LGFIGIVPRDRAAYDAEDDGEKDFNVAPVSAGGPKDLRHLADALGVSTSFAEDSQAASGIIPRRRFSLP
jgi:hypothetical protein